MREEMKTIMIEKYYDSASHNFGDGTQFSNAFALVLGLVPEEETKAVAKSLVMDIKERGYALTTGIFGTKYVMDALCDHGYGDVAMKLLLREEYPGWMYLIKGRTTLPENWQGGGSGNHCMFGSVDAVFYKMLAGIKQAEGSVGFQNVVIRPHFAYELEYVKAECETVKGVIRSCWERIGDEINVTVRIPEGCTGTFVHNGSTTELRQGENILRICAV